MLMEVADIEADLINYREPNAFNVNTLHYVVKDFQVTTRYENVNTFTCIVKRLDDTGGWEEELDVLVNYIKLEKTSTVHIGKSFTSEKEVIVHTADAVYPSLKPTTLLPTYRFAPCPPPSCITREEFNEKFKTDIKPLSQDLYAVGLREGNVFVYNDVRNMWYEILPAWRHIISVALTFTQIKHFYFIVCCSDGYMEELRLNDKGSYHVLHSKRWIFCNSAPIKMPYTIGMADRHVLHLCEGYHHLRSFHNGIPFRTKISKIIYGGRIDRGTPQNFTTRTDIDVNPRQYFYSDAVPKTNIVCSPNVWIKDREMVNYKYILDIDGLGSTWDGTAWKLNSGSVIMKSDSRWQQWFYDDYKPWVHYVPIKDDFSDIDEKFAWCEANSAECEQIVKNAKALFQKAYRFHNIVNHTKKLIELML